MFSINDSFTCRTVIAAAILATSSVASIRAHAEPVVESQRVVRFEDLNLSTSRGAASLYNRLQAASRSVCSPLAGRGLEQVKKYNECYAKALDSALRDVKGLTSTENVADLRSGR